MPDIILAERKHPLYDGNIDVWDLLYSAVKGGDNFINEDNLFTHRLEATEDYDERLDRAYFLNLCDVIPSIYNSYIFKETIERSPDEVLAQFRRSTDGHNTNISEFIAKVGYFSKVYGSCHVLVDMPAELAGKKTERQVQDEGLYPYCTIVHPTELVDWSLDAQGNFNWIVVQSTYYNDLDPTKEREEKTHYKLITLEDWKIEDENGDPAKFEDGSPNQGPNELGIIPLITVYHKDLEDATRVGESLLKDIIYINRAMLNWCSCIDEQIERQTFSQLVVPDDGTLAEESETGDDPLRKVGNSTAWTFPSDATHAPQFISPNSDSVNIIWRLVIDHAKECFRIAGLIGASDDMYVSKSGRAAQMGFIGVNSALAETAKGYEGLENAISKLSYMFQGKNIDDYEDVKYPTQFDISSLGDEINSYFKVMGTNVSPTLNKTIMKNISRRAVPLAPQSVRESIESEIESSSGIIIIKEEGGDEISATSTDDVGDGNPNSNLGKTNRSKGDVEEEETGKKKKEE